MPPQFGGASASTPPKTRTRSGCLNCRRRRRKCDGEKPGCRNCELRGETCSWGLKVSFHQSRNLSLTPSEAALLRFHGPVQETLSIIDETESIVLEVQAETSSRATQSADGSPTRLRAPADASPVSSPTAARPPEGNEIELPNHTTSNLDTAAIPEGSPLEHECLDYPIENDVASENVLDEENHLPHGEFQLPFSLGQAVVQTASPQPEPLFPVGEEEKLHLISCFLNETGRWCETTDSQMQFTVGCIHSMMKSKPFVAAATALASRQLDIVGNQPHQTTLELYQYTLQLLIRRHAEDIDPSILATCTLLCVYEMMASDVSEWRRHLRGCAELLRAKKWNGSSGGIVKSCFWAFARIDVWAAFITQQQTLIPTDSWVQTDSVQAVASTGDLDDYCNLAILFFARIVNIMASMNHLSGNVGTEFAAALQGLWERLQEWYLWRPEKARPLVRWDREGSNPFPRLVYSQSSPICGTTFYHAGSLLLLQSGLLRSADPALEKYDQIWHARELGGISTSNISHENWVNQLQPLYISGHAFTNVHEFSAQQSFWIHLSAPSANTGSVYSHAMVTEEYALEKIVLLRQLSRIERETGWKTSERAAQLRELWGFG